MDGPPRLSREVLTGDTRPASGPTGPRHGLSRAAINGTALTGPRIRFRLITWRKVSRVGQECRKAHSRTLAHQAGRVVGSRSGDRHHQGLQAYESHDRPPATLKSGRLLKSAVRQ